MSIDAAQSIRFFEAFIAVKRAVSLSGWRALSHLRLGPGQVRLLRAACARSPLPQGELAKEMGMDPSAASRAVNSLIALGYLRRRRSDVDRRVLLVELTAAGRRASARLDRAWRRMAVLLTREFDARDLRAFERVAAKLVSAAEPKPRSRRR